ncbi:MAG TPA: recombinase family protein [Solirubrobacteraceae bacterium]|nr:recombinase family protein [Solirubrobacteraceae bacterium]
MRELGGSAERTAARQAAGQCIGRLSVPLMLMLVSAQPPPTAESAPAGRDWIDQPAGRPRTLIVDGYVGCGGERTSAAPASVQRWQITRWADARGWRLGRIFEEPVGGRSPDAAPALRQALDRVEARESDGIVITRLDQIGDSLADALDSIERIQAAGGIFVSACDGVDLSTSTGRLIFRLLLSIREWVLPTTTHPS